MSLEAHVVTHTHWDREWYLPFERFQQRLVALVDELLDAPPRRGESFLLDGQAIVLEDYVAVRPDRAEALRALLADGRIEAGPWYVLADELIPSGESLVRNLLAGARTLRQFGAHAPPVLYCPDSFGHPAALPAIAAGFGLPVVLLWRGYGGPHWPAGDTARWAAPNGDEVVLFHLPRDGYEFGSHLPADDAGATERWQRMRAELVPRSTTGVMLVPHGADHHARQANHEAAVATLERAGAADGVHRSALGTFARRLADRAAAHRLPVVRGELRDSSGYAWSLQGTFGTRAHEKRANAIAERALLREAEPWSALAAIAGRSRRSLVDAAWRTLLTTHPHDTLCGCSIDEVARGMELRQRAAVVQANGIRDDSMLDLVKHDPVAARAAGDAWTPVVLLRNPAVRARAGVALIEIEEWLADVPVGPRSATAAPARIATDARHRPTVPSLGSLQVIARDTRYSRTESPRHYPDNDLVSVTTVAAWVREIPAYGITSHSIGSGEARRPRPSAPVVVERGAMHNAALALSVSDAGRITIVHRASGRTIEDAIWFVDEEDAGDLYTPSIRPRVHRVEFRGARIRHRGPLRGELELRYRLRAGAAARGEIVADLRLALVLDADTPFVRLHVEGSNRAANHRLRLIVRPDVSGGMHWADAAFGPVRRLPTAAAPPDWTAEQPLPTAPLQRYVSRFDEHRGCTLYGDGLAEYEARDDGTLLVTLVRAVGQLSKNDLPERPGHAGWPSPTPDAQCLGAFAGEFALLLHGARTAAVLDEIERIADDVLSPIVGTTLRSALDTPRAVAGPELLGAGLAFSAIKESEDGAWLVLRCVNVRDEEVSGAWRLPFEPHAARLALLDETIISELEIQDREIPFTAPARGIVTILVRCG
ncbi:MAG TPA: glycosyl hydrolase-related protein [Gemmatimonadaceae bacterium]|nr:glycosyl hydrolase-related protein [Gemmatimonadaceae bacterium]